MTARTVKVDGKELARVMAERGMTVEALAKKIGCSPRTIAGACKGRGVYRSTLGLIAAALKVEGRRLLAWEEGDDSATYRIQIVIRADSKKLEQSPVIHRFVDLLQTLVQATDAFQLEGITEGSAILHLATSERGATGLAALFPEFDEHAREAIRRTGPGAAYFSGAVMPEEQAGEVAALLDLVDSVEELRIPVAAPAQNGPSEEDVAEETSAAGQVELQAAPEPNQDAKAAELNYHSHLGELQWLEPRLKELEQQPPGEERDTRIAEVRERIRFCERAYHEELIRWLSLQPQSDERDARIAEAENNIRRLNQPMEGN